MIEPLSNLLRWGQQLGFREFRPHIITELSPIAITGLGAAFGILGQSYLEMAVQRWFGKTQIMLTNWIAALLRLLCIATTAFSFGVGCAGSFYYGPRIQKERSALLHYKAQLAMAHAQLIEAQAKVVIQTESLVALKL